MTSCLSTCCSCYEKEAQLLSCKSCGQPVRHLPWRSPVRITTRERQDGLPQLSRWKNEKAAQADRQQTVKERQSSGYPCRTRFGVLAECTQTDRVETYLPCNLPFLMSVWGPLVRIGSSFCGAYRGFCLSVNCAPITLSELERIESGDLTTLDQDAGKLH